MISFTSRAMYIGVAFALFGLLGISYSACSATPIPNAKCIDSVGSGTCDSAGNAVCNWWYINGPENCGQSCFYCPGNDDMPESFCTAMEGSQCTPTSGNLNICQNGVKQQGTCVNNNDGTCICTNLTPGAACTGVGTYSCS